MTNQEKKELGGLMKRYISHGYTYREIVPMLLDLNYKRSTIRAYYKAFSEKGENKEVK